MNSTTADGPIALAAANGECSPLTEFFNSPNDFLFGSVTTQSHCANTSDNSGCIRSFNITNGFPMSSSKNSDNSNVPFVDETGGTSAIIIDNASASSGASSIYFSTLGNQSCGSGGSAGGCAVKLTQSALQ